MSCRDIVIAIAGRANVGKSTLFNRLVGARKSITTSIAGTTRDIIEGKCSFGGIPVTLIDTGGISDGGSEMDRIVSKKALSVLDGASIILFMLDMRKVNGEDDILLESFRKYADKIILVVNKVDDPSHDNLVWNFHSYGYKRVCAISASHARGIGELDEAVSDLIAEKHLADGVSFESDSDSCDDTDDGCLDGFEDQYGFDNGFDAADDDGLGFLGADDDVDDDCLDEIQRRLDSAWVDEKRIAISIMGKPNTGKSTLSNLLLSEDKSIVSDIAGTTRDIVTGEFEYKGVVFSVCDTAGIRRKSKVSEDIEYFSVNRAIGNISKSDVVLLVVDCQEGITDQDKKIASLAVERGAGVVLVLNKIDLLGLQSQYNAIVDRLRFLFPQLSFAPVVGISAKKHTGIPKLLDTVLAVRKQLNVKLSTSGVNRALEKWNQTFSPPRNGAIWYKVLYATQVSISPVRFLFIVNRKKGFPDSYISYVKNRMRKQFRLDMIPISVILRERTRKDKRQAVFSSVKDKSQARHGVKSGGMRSGHKGRSGK